MGKEMKRMGVRGRSSITEISDNRGKIGKKGIRRRNNCRWERSFENCHITIFIIKHLKDRFVIIICIFIIC